MATFGGAASAITTVFGRTGAVVSVLGDYFGLAFGKADDSNTPQGQTDYRDFFDTDTTIEENAQNVVPAACRMDLYTVRVPANTASVTTTFRVRKNAVDANQTVTVASSTTGVVRDTTNTDTFAAADLFSTSIAVPVGTGGINHQGPAIRITAV